MRTLIFLAISLLSGCSGTRPVQTQPEENGPPIKLISWYVDNTNPNAGNIVLFEKNGKPSALWLRDSYDTNPQLLSFPVDGFTASADGGVAFTILQTSGRDGREVWQIKFSGKVAGDALTGDFESDWPSLAPQRFDGKRKSEVDPDMVSQLVAKSEDFRNQYKEVETCLAERAVKPESEPKLLGNWSNYGTDGEHEWGYDVVLIQIGNATTGLIEDFTGLYGDGGDRVGLKPESFSNGGFSVYSGAFTVTGKRVGKNVELRQTKYEKVQILKPKKTTLEEAYQRYLYVAKPCFAEEYR